MGLRLFFFVVVVEVDVVVVVAVSAGGGDYSHRHDDGCCHLTPRNFLDNSTHYLKSSS